MPSPNPTRLREVHEDDAVRVDVAERGPVLRRPTSCSHQTVEGSREVDQRERFGRDERDRGRAEEVLVVVSQWNGLPVSQGYRKQRQRTARDANAHSP